MAAKLIQILHLTETSLCWVTLEKEHRQPRLRSRGELQAEPARSLEEWARTELQPQAEIRLYDGRPRYFSFKFTLPRAARSQLESIARLKIRQELGLGEDAVYWTVCPMVEAAPSDSSGPLEMMAIVARRESLRDLVDWRQRHHPAALWVAADLCAIPPLMQAARLESPLLIINSQADGATLFFAEDQALVTRHRLESANGHLPDPFHWPPLSENPCPRIHFGPADVAPLLLAHPELAVLAPLAPWKPREDGTSSRLTLLDPKLPAFDAVILGGIAALESAQPPPPSLIADGLQKPMFATFQQKLNLRRLAPLIVLLGLALIVSLWGIGRQRESARRRLVEQADKLRSRISLLQLQQTVLERIGTERAPLIPAIEAIHQAAPAGLGLQSFHLGEAGTISLQGSAPNTDATYLLNRAMSESNLFDNVQLLEVKQDERGQVSSFHLTARMKGRVKR
jgi:Tfp pilus assembly protein PilN